MNISRANAKVWDSWVIRFNVELAMFANKWKIS